MNDRTPLDDLWQLHRLSAAALYQIGIVATHDQSITIARTLEEAKADAIRLHTRIEIALSYLSLTQEREAQS